MSKISVIMILFNRLEYTKIAINSILGQSFKDWELLLIDNCSTENIDGLIVPLLKDPRIKYTKNNVAKPIWETRQEAIKSAKSEYVAIIDNDDIWLDENKLRKQINFLDSHPEYFVIGTRIKEIDKEGNLIKLRENQPLSYEEIKEKSFQWKPSM